MGKRTYVSDIIDDLLVAVATAGALGLSIVAPNSLVALEKPLKKLLGGGAKRKEAKRIGRYLKQQKLVETVSNEDGSYQVTLSDKGVRRTKRVQFEKLEIPESKWDEKWRIIMFDIPEQYKSTRDYISKHLRLIGFEQLQRSVFVYPYPVDEFVALLYEIFPEVERHVFYMVVEDIDQHNVLVKQFKTIL